MLADFNFLIMFLLFKTNIFFQMPDVSLKIQRDPDSEFYSIHFGIEINKFSKFFRPELNLKDLSITQNKANTLNKI